MRILLIEDDDDLRSAVHDHLVAGGHAVDWAEGLSGARGHAAVAGYDVILLDVHLPDGNGIDYLRELIKGLDTTPVIILTARDRISHRIEGLNAGADDYLVKPFDLGELSARIRAVARRQGHFPEPQFSVGTLSIQAAERRLFRDGQEVHLSGREWAVLDCLLRQPGSVVSKGRIEHALYSFNSEFESNTVEVYVSRLRKKIGGDRIATVRGSGYRLVVT